MGILYFLKISPALRAAPSQEVAPMWRHSDRTHSTAWHSTKAVYAGVSFRVSPLAYLQKAAGRVE